MTLARYVCSFGVFCEHTAQMGDELVGQTLGQPVQVYVVLLVQCAQAQPVFLRNVLGGDAMQCDGLRHVVGHV